MAKSTALNPSPTAFGSVSSRGTKLASGPASQPGKARVLRGTSTEGPPTAASTTSSVETDERGQSHMRGPAANPNLRPGDPRRETRHPQPQRIERTLAGGGAGHRGRGQPDRRFGLSLLLQHVLKIVPIEALVGAR